MDSAIGTAARALAAGDPLTALQHVALRSDAPALALRGIAMAQLGEFADAKRLLRRAAARFGEAEPLARARCVVAQAEVALALRDLGSAERGVDEAVALLSARGDIANAALARLVRVRRWTLLGEVEMAQRELELIALPDRAPRLVALVHLAAADLAMRRVDAARAEQALFHALDAARRSRIVPLVGEIEAAHRRLREPIARLIEDRREVLLTLQELPRLWASGKLVVDACRREVRLDEQVVRLVTRPVLVELLVALVKTAPRHAARDELITNVFGARRINDSHRVRLRVEIGRLRKLLTGLAEVRAIADGYHLLPRAGTSCALLLPPTEGDASALLGLLRGGEAWGTADLAAALGKSQRTVQRALAELEHEGLVRSVGDGRSRRWVGAPSSGFATTLLLVTPESVS